ncbi:MAG: dihydroneopterin aldolase [Hyphomicrobiaceae bacterium]
MPCRSTIELRNLTIQTQIGTYGPADVVPAGHVLDLTLAIDPQLVLIAKDEMAQVFDYDPLIAEIDRLAGDCHYATQERLITRIVDACTAYPQIDALEIRLTKEPVLAGSGSLGVCLVVDTHSMAELRRSRNGYALLGHHIRAGHSALQRVEEISVRSGA